MSACLPVCPSVYLSDLLVFVMINFSIMDPNLINFRWIKTGSERHTEKSRHVLYLIKVF